MTISGAKIRRQILKQRGVELKKHTRKPVSVDQLPAPYKKTRLMQLIELRHGQRLENIIYTGTIYEVERKIGVDASTVSKWRKLIDEIFFRQFTPAEGISKPVNYKKTQRQQKDND